MFDFERSGNGILFMIYPDHVNLGHKPRSLFDVAWKLTDWLKWSNQSPVEQFNVVPWNVDAIALHRPDAAQ